MNGSGMQSYKECQIWDYANCFSSQAEHVRDKKQTALAVDMLINK